MIIPQQDQDDYRNALQQLYDLLNKAYWYATTIDAKDAINGLAQAAFEVLTTLNQGALDSDTDQYQTLKATVAAVNAKLQTVQTQINNWVHAISIATQAANVIDQAINYAAKVFKV